jgi:NADH-quinone oxidoreductase subunit E
MQIPPQLQAQVDEAITHYPVSKRSASLPLLHLFQEHFGYISEDMILWIAARLELEPLKIEQLVSFYPMFHRHPAGRVHIRICRTLSCALAGAAALKSKILEAAGIPPLAHGTTPFGPVISVSPDGKYSLEEVECLASCGSGPVIMVNDDLYERVTADEIPTILSKY